jgi:hypothetical protein
MGTTTTKRKLNMEKDDIEKLKEAAFKASALLKVLPHHGSFHGFTGEDRAEIISAIDAFRAKPEPFEAWANFYQGFFPVMYRDAEAAESNAGDGARRIAVHLREVTPAPERERFTGMELRSLWLAGHSWDRFAEKINAEIERAAGTEGKS